MNWDDVVGFFRSHGIDPDPETAERAKRALGLTVRAGMEGATALPQVLGMAMEGAGIRGAGENVGGSVADWMGIPRPETNTEKVVNAASSAMAGGGPLTGVGKMLPAATKFDAARRALTANQGQQALFGATSGAAGEEARQYGYGPVGQFVAAIVAPLGVAGAMTGARSARGTIKNIGSREKAVRTVHGMMPGETTTKQTIDILRRANPKLTTAQAIEAGGGDSSLFGGLEKAIRGSEYDRLIQNKLDAQTAEELARLQGAGRGATNAESLASQAAMKSNLERNLAPVREEQLARAGKAGTVIAENAPIVEAKNRAAIAALQNKGRMQTEAAQQRSMMKSGEVQQPRHLIGAKQPLPEGNYPQDPRIVPSAKPEEIPQDFESMDRAIGNARAAQQFEGAAQDVGDALTQRLAERDAAQARINALRDEGLKPLDLNPVMDHIKGQLRSKTVRVTPDEEKVLSTVLEKLKIVGEGGVADPEALYQLRKVGINQAIDSLASRGELSKQGAAAALTKLKPMLDKALEDAGATQWGEGYMKKYAAGMKEIDQVGAMNKARELYQQSPENFLDLVRGNKTSMIEDLTGGKTDLADYLEPDQLRILNTVGDMVDIRQGVNAKANPGGTMEIMRREGGKTLFPQLLHRGVALTNAMLNKAEEHFGRDFAKELAKASADPNEMIRLLNTLPFDQRNWLMTIIPNYNAAAISSLRTPKRATDEDPLRR